MKKIAQALSLLSAAACHGTLAFAPSASHRPTSTTLRAGKHDDAGNAGAAAAGAFLLGVSISAQAAFADTTFAQPSSADRYPSPAIESSTLVQAAIDQFSLPSYDTSKGLNLIDLSGEVASVNNKIQTTAKEKREYVDNSKEKKEMEKLRREEKEGNNLLESLGKQSEVERKALIEAEKAETRANRWNTF